MLFRSLSQHLHRHLHAHAVVAAAGLEDVVQPQGQVPLHPGVGVAGGVVAAGQQQFTGEVQQIGAAALLAPPLGVEIVGAVDVVGHALVVEAEEGLVVGQEAVDAAAALDVAELLD